MKQKKSKLNKTTIKSIVTKIKSKVKNNDKKGCGNIKNQDHKINRSKIKMEQ